ncbi:hypothetical protein C4D43_09690 [Clostridium perfringens]|uniref:CAP domain-containing protein n=1 Tax=Clostridium perfringens TaxID=1502 RepID=UPI000D709DA9|nr:CAP domain-containing protein [Clostridium perfringens]PWX38563.1 hypothetical protein CYK90_12945 [Clostridium perfringens]PWX56969.1 hypothetical protein CYK89_01580 [Clostridium perfringens]
MSKKIKELMEFIKVHKKETIGVAVALGIAVIGVGGYAISKNYTNKDANNVALAEKKEDSKTDEAKKVEEDNEEVTVEEQEDGSLIVKDKDGNTIADSSKGDDVSKIIEEKKEAGSNVNIKNKNGEVEKVESVENGNIKVASGETISPKTESKKSTSSEKQNGEKVEKVEDVKGATASSEGSITIIKPSKDESSSKPESKPQEQPKEEKTEEPSQPSQKDEEKQTEKPQETKPVEPVKPQKPERTWEYQSSMSQELWNDFNAYRQSKGLNALNWSGKYAEWTKSHCEEMAKKEDAFHKSYPEGAQIVGFNGSNMNANKILQQFKNSPAHNKNMLYDDVTEGACAVYKDSNGVYYFVIGMNV